MPETTLSLQRIARETAVIEIKGTAPLIVHRWAEKAREEMLGKQQGRKTAKVSKDPQADFEAARYKFADDSGDGFPTTAFKKATVLGGGRIFGKSIKMTELRQNLLFIPDGMGTDGMQLTAITGTPVMREDMVRIGMGTADIRHRPMYEDWTASLKIQYIPNLIDLGSIVALVDAGGTNGIGEWRPEKNGSYGTYEVVDA